LTSADYSGNNGITGEIMDLRFNDKSFGAKSVDIHVGGIGISIIIIDKNLKLP
jgi:hypothetical protein